MNITQFFEQLDAVIAKYDLLCHPYYRAWAAGALTHNDLREYACQYYHHVEAFPSYLAELASRLNEGKLQRAVLSNMYDEQGMTGAQKKESDGVPHSELWLDFAEGMGACRDMRGHIPVTEMGELIQHFFTLAKEGTPEEALAAFYVYESQVPRVAKEKERGLREMYGADDRTCGYFTLHATADIYHSNVWRKQLQDCLTAKSANSEAGKMALCAAEKTAKMLWQALDGIELNRVLDKRKVE